MGGVIVVVPSKYKSALDEELSLVKTVYDKIDDVLFVRKPNPKYYISLDKISELRNSNPDKIVIMDRAKPSQVVNLMREVKKEVIDRILLILEIFELHAGSLEAKLQIELARLRHRLPLIREAIRQAKLGELHGFLGAGRYGYEKYYTMLKAREARIREKLAELRKIRGIRRHRRIEMGFPHIAIIGYTCAGKTTLFNRITKSAKPVGPEPFTTLTPKSSRITYDGVSMVITDTVGFIRDFPHEIIEAFYATLEEIKYSDVLIHVIDSSKPVPRLTRELDEARKILSHIGVHGKPTIMALNKIDLVSSEKLSEVIEYVKARLQSFETLITISAEKGINVENLLSLVKKILEEKGIGENLRFKIWP